MTVNENEFFRHATLRISSSLIVEVAMERCMDFLKQHIPVNGMVFSLYDPQMNIAEKLASIWPPEIPEPDDTIYFSAGFWTWMKKKLEMGPGTTIINDVNKEEPPVRQTVSMFLPEDTSLLTMDLQMEERRLGSLILFAKGKNRYSDYHARLISLLHEPFAIAMSNIQQHREIRALKDMLADDNRYLHQEMLRMTGDTIVGADFGLRNVMKMVGKAAPLESPILLMGETGAGKEVIANAIHFSSSRRNGPYITVNCGAIPENLIDSELFGHERGAFTGAIADKRGRFERADKGTIFLDEIGDLPMAAQARLLRVLQQHEIERVGGSEPIPVDTRIISATHRDLEEMVRMGDFREDLWFRLNVFPIVIPPLRQRVEDIPALLVHFLERKSKELKIRKPPSLAPGVLEKLQGHSWPGNVRELENLVERALILGQVTGEDNFLRLEIPSGIQEPMNKWTAGKNAARSGTLDEVLTTHIESALALSDGKVEGVDGAARMLGVNPSTLRGKMRKLGILHGRKRRPRLL